MEKDGYNINTGRPGMWVTSLSHKPAMSITICLWWMKQPPDGWRHIPCHSTKYYLEKEVLWWHGTPERIESDSWTHLQKNLIDTWAKEHGIEWICYIAYHASASGKIKWNNGLLKTMLRAMRAGTFKHWYTELAKVFWFVITWWSADPGQSKLLHTIEGDKVPMVHIRNILGTTVWVIPVSGKGKPACGLAFAQGLGCMWWVTRNDGDVWFVPQGDLMLGKNNQ